MKCNCGKMVSKYATGQGERYSRDVNKFSLRILTYHKKNQNTPYGLTCTKHLHEHKQALFKNHRERRASPFTKKHLEDGGDPGGDGVASRPTTQSPVPKVRPLKGCDRPKGSDFSGNYKPGCESERSPCFSPTTNKQGQTTVGNEKGSERDTPRRL